MPWLFLTNQSAPYFQLLRLCLSSEQGWVTSSTCVLKALSPPSILLKRNREAINVTCDYNLCNASSDSLWLWLVSGVCFAECVRPLLYVCICACVLFLSHRERHFLFLFPASTADKQFQRTLNVFLYNLEWCIGRCLGWLRGSYCCLSHRTMIMYACKVTELSEKGDFLKIIDDLYVDNQTKSASYHTLDWVKSVCNDQSTPAEMLIQIIAFMDIPALSITPLLLLFSLNWQT